MQTKRLILVPVLILALLSMSGCGGQSPIVLLEAVISTVEATFPIIAAAMGLPPATGALVSTYLSAVSTAVEQTATILASSASAATKATEIAAAFAAVIAPNLPPGTPQTIVTVIQAVINAVANFLKATSPTAPAAKNARLANVSARDQLTLADIRARAAVAHQKALAIAK